MPAAPSWFKPLTALQRRDLLDLFEQATGVEIHSPPIGHDTPSGWLTEFAAASQPHVDRMTALASTFTGQAREEHARNFVYDPRQQRR